MKTILWLDDIRDPYSHIGNPFDTEIVWVKDYNEFVNHIQIHGLPDMISFDHDLADEHYNPDTWNTHQYIEKTGYDCAKWLVDYCLDSGKKLPDYKVHSANPVGAENIKKYLENAEKQTTLKKTP